MATKGRKFRRTTAWKRAGEPIASLMHDGSLVRIDFEYTPARVKAVKAIQGARFDGTDKSWTIPLAGVSTLLQHKEFPAATILNGLSPTDDSEIERLSRVEARDGVRKAPFRSPEAAIRGACLDLVVRLNSGKHRLRVVPRIGSDAHRIIKRFRGAIFAASDSAYTVPADRVAELVKRLRDDRLLFALDEEAGAALADSAPARSAIISSPGDGGSGWRGDDLTKALLVPFITSTHRGLEQEEPLFRPCFFTAEQFRMAFPKNSLRAQRHGDQPFMLDGRGLLALAGRLSSLIFPIWLTEETAAYLARRRKEIVAEISSADGPVDDLAAEVSDLPAIWRVASSGRGVLAMNLTAGREMGEVIAQRITEVLDRKIDTENSGVLIEIPDSQLGMVLAEVEQLGSVHGFPEIPRSKGFDALAADVRERTKARENTAYFTALEDVDPRDVPGLPEVESSRLFPHQRVAVRWLSQTPYAFLGDDMGLGKTLSVLSYFSALRNDEGYELLLVVCPNSLTRNWLRELSMWFPSLRGTVLAGDKSSKAWALRLLTSGTIDHEVLIVNYEAVRLEYVTPELEKLVSKRRALLCLDESQRVKNSTSKIFKAVSEIAPLCSRRVLLSGTPTPKDVSDLWAQMRILDGGDRFGKSFYRWLSTVADLGTEYSEFAVKKFNEEAVQESVLRVHEVMLRRRKERVVNLPEKTFSLREIEMTGAQKDRYDEIREGLVLRMRSLSGEQFVRDITNILEEYLRAVQVASNPRLIDSEWKGTPAKFAELDEIVDEVVRQHDQKIVIWTNYLGNVRELTERYKEFGAASFSGEVSAADREVAVRAFQEKETPRVLIAVPAAGGVGITLTAAQTAVYVDKTWNAEHWMQSVDRLHRIGQRGTVNIISLLACKVDEIIHWNLRRKERTQAEILGDEKRGRGDESAHPTRKELLEALEE